MIASQGGPGGSGVDMVLGPQGPQISALVKGQYDLVGFDPRGVGHTLPNATCFDAASYNLWSATEVISIDNEAEVSLTRSRDEVIGASCGAALGGTGSNDTSASLEEWGGGRFMNTAQVANDMVSITAAFGQEKVFYYGVSYGSILGQNFAAMHPDKVGLIMIDGVLDAQTWHDAEINHSIQDADKVVDTLIELCTRAGPDVCPIAEKTKAATEARYQKIWKDLEANPLPIVGPAGTVPVVITTDLLRIDLHTSLYHPEASFASLAQRLAYVEARDATAFASLAAPPASTGPGAYSQHAIACSDMADISNMTLADAIESWREASKTAKSNGGIIGRLKLQCIKWPFRPAFTYDGPFGSSDVAGKILVSNAVFDSITPLSDARKVQKRFPKSSALLVVNSAAHGVLQVTSACANEVIFKFFSGGELPKNGLVCEPDVLPFVGNVTKGIS